MKKITAFVAIFFIVLVNISAASASPLNFDAKAYILIDKNSGQVLYEQNADDRIYPASLTKVLTAVVALESGKLEQEMTASLEAVNDIGDGGSNIGILAGEKFTMEALLNALLIKSANETANIIAENISPTRQDFIDLMNRKAAELGATGTHFVNTCGIHDDNHYTTARDLSVFTRYAMSLQTFRDIVAKPYLNMPVTDKHPSWPVLASTNKLLGVKSDYFSKVIGVKTGYTGQAGNNLISAAVNDSGMELIAVVVGIKGTGLREVYSKELLEYGFKNFSIQEYVQGKTRVKHLEVKDSADEEGLDLITSKSLSCVLPNDKSGWNIQTSKHIKSSVAAPVKKGDVLGYIEYKRDGILLGKVNVVASRSIEKSFSAKFRDSVKSVTGSAAFKRTVIAVVAIVIGFILLRLILRRISRQVHSKKQQG